MNKKLAHALLICTLLLSPVLIHSEEKPGARKLEELIAPVLKARCEAVKDEKDLPAAEYDRKVNEEAAKVAKDKSEAGDEAVVVLMDYWLGEGAGLGLTAEITERGKRLLPVLKKYAKEPPPLASPCKYAMQDEDIRRGIFKMLTDMVEKGEKLN